MKKLSFKGVAKNMSVQDMAKLIFADRHLRNASGDKRRLLNSGDEEAMLRDCAKRGLIYELNHYNELFNMSMLCVLDVERTRMGLELAVSRINTFVVAMYYRNAGGELLDEIIDMLAIKAGDKGEFSKYLEEKKVEMFSCSAYSLLEDGESGKGQIPNKLLQKLFVLAIKKWKLLERALFMISYLEESAGFDLLSEDDRSLVNEAKVEGDNFKKLDGFLQIVNVYKMQVESELLLEGGFEEDFMKLIVDPDSLFVFDESEREEVKNLLKKKMKW